MRRLMPGWRPSGWRSAFERGDARRGGGEAGAALLQVHEAIAPAQRVHMRFARRNQDVREAASPFLLFDVRNKNIIS
jgi:hypothetical protein